MSRPSEPVETVAMSRIERVGAELHDGALAELLLDLADGQVERALAIRIHRHGSLHSAPPRVRTTFETIIGRTGRRRKCEEEAGAEGNGPFQAP